MKRPDNPIVTALEASISKVYEAERSLAEAKTLLGTQARSISALTDKQERENLAVYLVMIHDRTPFPYEQFYQRSGEIALCDTSRLLKA